MPDVQGANQGASQSHRVVKNVCSVGDCRVGETGQGRFTSILDVVQSLSEPLVPQQIARATPGGAEPKAAQVGVAIDN